MTTKLSDQKYRDVIERLLNFIDSNETEFTLAPDSSLRQKANSVLTDDTPRAESDGHAIMIVSMGQWGKGRSIYEAASNHPADLTTISTAQNTECLVQVFSWKKGDMILEGADSMYDCIYVDGMGATNYAADMNVIELNKNPIALTRLFREDAMK